MQQDPWRTLGLDRNASVDDVKKAFRKQILECHPDKHLRSPEHVKKEAEATFKRLKSAYEYILHGGGATGGRDGVNRSHGNQRYNSYQYNSHGYQNTEFYRNRRNRNPFSSSTAGAFFKTFAASGSMAATAVLGGVFVAGVVFLDPILSSLWASRNQGKLFADVQLEVEMARKQRIAARNKMLSRQRAALYETLSKDKENLSLKTKNLLLSHLRQIA